MSLKEDAASGGFDPLRVLERVVDRTALHCDDRVMAVPPLRGCRETCDVARGDPAHQPFERHRWDVVAFVDEHEPVAGEVDVFAAYDRLDHRDVDVGGRRWIPGSDASGLDAEELLQLV